MVTPPNFVLLDSTLPDVVRLVTAMVTDRFPLVVEALARLRSRYCIIVGLGGAAAWPRLRRARSRRGSCGPLVSWVRMRIRPQTNGSALAQRLRDVET
jgi:hypothetical protein